MKNILITTAALVMTAGVASAEVTFSGSGGAGVSNSGDDSEIWSGIDFNFSGSVTTDSGMTLSVGEDIGGGQLVDWGDKEVDTLGATPGTPTITITSGSTSITLEGQGIDDLYDDDQSGDIGFSTTMAGASIGLTLDTAATGTVAAVTGAGCAASVVTGVMACTTDAVAAAAANPSFSYSISLPMAGFTVTAIGTDANDDGDAANKLSAAYVMGDTTLTLSTDDSGAGVSVNKLAVATMMGGASIGVSADDADDWDLSVGYTEGTISVSVSTDEGSAWETDVSVDLGGGAAFKVSGDSNDFVAAGVTFSF